MKVIINQQELIMLLMVNILNMKFGEIKTKLNKLRNISILSDHI